MFRTLSRLLGRPAAVSPSAKKPSRTRLGLETLEARDVPAVSVAVAGSLSNNTVTFTSDNASDTVVVTRLRNFYDADSDSYIPGAIQYTVNGQYTDWVHAWGGDRSHAIVFLGNGGNDKFVNNTELTSSAWGGIGNDSLYGGGRVDYLYGQGDNDMIFGYNSPSFGGDHMHGGAGRDYLLGSESNDYMYGNKGSDTLIGMGGDDYLFGHEDKDFLYGSSGRDQLDGGDDRIADYLNGGLGGDKFQMDGRTNNPLLANSNRDKPVDFTPSQGDSYYGADPLVAQYVRVFQLTQPQLPLRRL